MSGESIVITLASPIMAHGETLTMLTLRRPKARELRSMPMRANMVMGDLYDVAAACADVPASSIDQLDAADLMQVMEVIGDFLGVGSGMKRSS